LRPRPVIPPAGSKGKSSVRNRNKSVLTDGSDVDVVGRDPHNPVKVRERLEDVVGEPEVDEHGGEAVLQKEAYF
jgi:hypothetical protein